MMKLRNTLFFFILSLSLAGCGYHLRGSGVGKIDTGKIFLETTNASLIVNELREQLRVRDVKLVNTLDQADRIIRLGNERYDRRVLSVDEGTGKVTEYELEYHITLEILSPDGKKLIKPNDISLIRDVTFDPNAALGKFDEETLVREDMIRSAASTVLRRLQAVQ